MSPDEIKAEIVSAIRQELSNLHVAVEDRDIRTTEDGKTWSIWIVQENGIDATGDKFEINLEELNDGVGYLTAISYRVRRWVTFKKNMEDLKMAAGQKQTNRPILMADDDEGDRFLTAKALKANFVENAVVAVSDGEELLDYLHRRGKFADSAPAPCFILLDLNMPKMNGREALKIIKADEKLRGIPIVILSTSGSEEDVSKCYESGANSYIMKPPSFVELVEAMRSLQNYWLNVVQLPVGKNTQN